MSDQQSNQNNTSQDNSPQAGRDQLENGATNENGPKKENGLLKFALDFGPLVLFFFANGQFGIMTATAIFMALMPVVMVISWKTQGHVPVMQWVTAVLVLVFGGLTLYFDDERFIKLKPTIINLMFASILFIGQLRGKIVLKTVMGAAMPALTERGWQVMNRNWTIFFLLMAGVNEYVWRSYDTDTWVSFKAFGFTAMTFIFALSQAGVLMKHAENPDEFK